MSDQHNQDLAGLVEETIRTLFDKGIAAADLAPLVKLHDAVKAPSAPSAAPVVPAAPVNPATQVNPAAPAIPAAPETGQVLRTAIIRKPIS